MESYVIEVVCRLKRVETIFLRLYSVFNLCHFLLTITFILFTIEQSQLNCIRNRFETDKKKGSGALLDTRQMNETMGRGG